MMAWTRCVRSLNGNRCFILLVALVLIAGNLPASAQSPVAGPAFSEHSIAAYACPAGFDAGAGNAQAAFDSCTQPHADVTFTLTSQDPGYQGVARTTDAGGATGWADIPAGVPYSIVQTVPDGYGDPWVYCRYFQQPGESGQSAEAFFPAPGGQMDVGLTDPSLTGYLDVTCNWFDVPADTAAIAAETGGTRLDIRAWQCPFHFDAAVASVNDLLANCTSPHRDANFIINGDPSTQQYTGSSGSTSYQSVPFGTVTIQQLAYASYDPVRVFCYTQPYTAPHGPIQASQEIGFTEEPGDTFSVSINVNPGDAIDCIWFDAHLTEDDLGTLLIHKYVCPDGTNTAGLDLDLLLHACPEPQVAYFQLLFGGGSSTGNETDSNGYLGFINFTPGSYPVREIAPFGYAPARIICRSYNADDWNHIVDPWVEQPIVDKTGMTVQIQAHWETECNWFDVKGVNYGYLDITAESCPLNFNPTSTTPRLTFAQQCQTGISGATFDIDSYPNVEKEVTSADGYALFQEHVTAGYLTISSTAPQTYTFVRAFCGDAPFIGIGAIPTDWTSFENGFVQYDVPVDYQVVCEFYYKPIAIFEGAASPAAVTSASEEESAPAGGEGSAAVEGSPVAVPTEVPGGETGSQGDQSGSAGGSQGQSGGTSGTSQPPADANAPATLTLVTFTCPPGYDLYAEDAVPSGDCADPATGIDFSLAAGDASAQQATSNAGGELSWTELTPGSYLLQATLPPDIASAFVADCVSDQRAFTVDNPLTPFAYAGPEGQIGITLLPGETLACTWYDIPVSQGGTVTGQLFTCPGATVIKAQCTPATGPATLHFEPAPGETVAPFDLQLGDDGAGQTAAPAGVYALAGIPLDACLVEADAFDASGQLLITEDAAIEVRVYTCG